MKFVKLGHWYVKADRIVAVDVHVPAMRVTIFCDDGREYPMLFATEKSTKEAHENLMRELSEIRG
jgi:hypothetical protein